MTAARRQPGVLMRRHRGARAVATHNREPRRKAPMALALGADTWSAAVTSAEARTFNASPTHEPRHAANYGDGWHPLNAPRLKPAQAGLKHGTSPRTPPRHGWQDIQAGSTRYEAMR